MNAIRFFQGPNVLWKTSLTLCSPDAETSETFEKSSLPREPCSPPALQRSHDIGGGHGLAVMELHSLAKVDGDGRAVAADFFAGCEQRLRLVVCVERVQPLEDVVGDGGGEIGCHHMLVEAGRLAHGGIVQGASGKGGRRDGAAESQQGDAGDESRRCSRMLHDGYLPSLGGADPRRRIGRVIVKMIFIYCNSTPLNSMHHEKDFLQLPARASRDRVR